MQKHITYLLLSLVFWGCQSDEAITAHEPKLDYYVESYDIPDLGFQPQLKVTYEYNSSGLPDAVNPYLEYTYEYLPDGRVSKIKETNTSIGINSEANFAYDQTNQSTKVSYTFSNGGSFEYEFHVSDGNVVTDKTTRGSQLCSDGQYTYDGRINPFKNLGYTDYLLTNLSANNKLSENTNYINCSFPSFIPETYSYEYDGRDILL
jgi:hypothetical protein